MSIRLLKYSWPHALMYSDLPSGCLDLLQELNAKDIQFFERNILGHLEGTYSILRGWNVGDDLALAGLFHAVYLTEFFVSHEPDENARMRVQAVIGDAAENLAYWYCVMNRAEFAGQGGGEALGFRDSYSGVFISLSTKGDQKLMELIWANSIEQIRASNGSFREHESLEVLFEASRHRVGANAVAEFELLR